MTEPSATGGPAFPRPYSQHDDANSKLDNFAEQDGMTLRDYFAAAALSRCIEVAAEFVMMEPDFVAGERKLSEIMIRAAKLAVFAADALLKERAK